MEQEILELVLTQLVEGQKEIAKGDEETAEEVKEIKAMVQGFDNRLAQVKIPTLQIDTQPVQKIVQSGLKEIAAIVAAQPKNVIQKKQYLLFPETDMDLLYRMVFGQVIPWVIVFFLALCGYGLLKDYLVNRAALRIKELEMKPFRAWDTVYHRQDEKGKKEMDSVWNSTSNE